MYIIILTIKSNQISKLFITEKTETISKIKIKNTQNIK